MIKNIFFDLDGTLLGMDQERFMRLYVAALREKLSAAGYDGPRAVDAVMKGTLAMLANDGATTNDRVFWTVFCKETGLKESAILPLMSEFYRAEFAAARAATAPFAESAAIVDRLAAKGYRLFLTTNAVFPREAIEARCAWAGIDYGAFEFVTLYDNCRFCKPHPGYFGDVLERFRLIPEQTLMIGNDREEDCAIETWGCGCLLTAENFLNRKGLPLGSRRVLTHAELLALVNEEF